MNHYQKQYFMDYAKTVSCLSQDEISEVLHIFSVKDVSRNEHLEEPGCEKSTIFLIVSGLLRYYYLGDDGKEWNKAFVSTGMMSTSFTKGFLTRSSPYGIQALEDTTVLVADYSSFEALYDRYHGIERMGRKILENILIFKMNRERSFLTDDAEERYKEFSSDYPDIMGRIPQYQIASYLGITEASLSRILKKK